VLQQWLTTTYFCLVIYWCRNLTHLTGWLLLFYNKLIGFSIYFSYISTILKHEESRGQSIWLNTVISYFVPILEHVVILFLCFVGSRTL